MSCNTIDLRLGFYRFASNVCTNFICRQLGRVGWGAVHGDGDHAFEAHDGNIVHFGKALYGNFSCLVALFKDEKHCGISIGYFKVDLNVLCFTKGFSVTEDKSI